MGLTVAVAPGTASATGTQRPAAVASPFRVVPSPSPGRPDLSATAAVSATDVWAVGDRYDTGRTLAEHWDGNAWTVVPTPTPDTTGRSSLDAISAVSSTDVWAVGSTRTAQSHGNGVGFIEHWNGIRGRLVASASPVPAETPGLAGVVAISSNDVYAVGQQSFVQSAATGTGCVGESFVEHWDGKVWSAVPFPGSASTRAVLALSPTNAIAVGDDISHWDGIAWTLVPNPVNLLSGRHLNAITSLSATDVWAVGFSAIDLKPWTTFAEHFDGPSWVVVPTPSPARDSELSGVSSEAGGHVYAVGTTFPNNFHSKTLILENDRG